MSNLLTFSQQVAIKKLSSNNESRFSELCKEVEQTDLKDLLGLALLQDLQANPTTTDNANLLSGTTFTNYYNQLVHHEGVRYVLAYLNHARYIGESSAADTYSGMVIKKNPDSEPLSEGAIKRLQAQSREIALSEFENVRQFLDQNFSLYPLWVSVFSVQPTTPKFSGISKTGYGKRTEMRCEVNGKRLI